MFLSPDTLAILRNFAGINQCILFTKDQVLGTIADSKSVIAQANIAEEFPAEFGIVDLSRLLSTISLFTDHAIDVKSNHLLIEEGAKGSCKASSQYYFANSSVIPEFPALEKIKKAIKDAEIAFDLEEDQLNMLIKGSGTLGTADVAIVSDGKKVFVSALDSKTDTSNTYCIHVGKGNGTKFKMILKTENFKMLMPKGKYEVRVSSNKISEFKNTSLNLTYWMSMEDTSVYG